MVDNKIRELCLKRIVSAVVWNVLLQAVFISVYLFFINVDAFHQLKWFQQWLFCIFSFSTWLYLVPLSMIIVAQGIVCSRDYLNLQPFYRTRFSFFIHMFSFHSLCVAFLYGFIGFLIPWVYLSLSTDSTYNRFVYNCSNGFMELECFSEERLYLILSCVFVNGYFLLDNHFLGYRHLSFPIIQLPKLVQVKSQFFTMIKETLHYTLVPNLIYIFLYYCFGSNLRIFITTTFSLYFNSLTPIDTIHSLFSLKRLFYLHFLTSITVSSMKLMEMLFKVHLTQHYIFPLSQSVLEDNNEIVLKDALHNDKYPIIQHLAYLDLVKLAEVSPQRRAEIYKLSSPGSHPHVWNFVNNECLSTIDSFVNELSLILVTSHPKKDLPEEKIPKSKISHAQPTNRLKALVKKNIFQPISDYFIVWLSNKSKWINNLPIVVYIFGEFKEMRISYALRKNLLVMWSAHTLSFLACHSLTEDNYGIVQNDLNQIITTLLKLKHVLDLLDRYFMTGYKMPRTLESYQKAVAIKNSVKRSLYRVANSYKSYITDFQLSKDVESKMMGFVNYKE